MSNSKSYRDRIYASYASAFQGSASSFDTGAAERWGRAYRHFFRGWLPQSKDARLLDVACGNGKLLYFFKQLGYRNLSGVDVSAEQIALSRQVTAEVVQQDAIEFLASRPNEYDLITALDVLEHLEKEEVLNALDLCYAALKKGGRLIVQTPNANGPWGSQLRYADFTHEVGFEPQSLAKLLRLTGYQDVVCRELGPVPWGYSLSSSARWLAWQFIRFGMAAFNLIETGSFGHPVYTRVMVVTGNKV